MTYPPTLPPANRTDQTVAAGNHAPDHNKIASALADIVAELGPDPAGAYADLTSRLAALTHTPTTGLPAAATDLPTALTLVNYMRTAGITLGLWTT